MKDIKELFAKIYGIKNPNEEQIQIFMDALKRRLTVRELEYVSFTYNVDLLGFEEVESRIIRAMKHPVIVKEIEEAKSEPDEVDEIFEKLKENEYITISLISRRCSKGFCSSGKIFNQMVERNMIIPTNFKKGYRVNKEYK